MKTVFLPANKGIMNRSLTVLFTILVLFFLSSCSMHSGLGDSSTHSSAEDTATEFRIEGKWKNIGEGTFGQVQSKGAIVVFDGIRCNLYSPVDKYGLEKKDDGTYELTLAGPFGDSVHFIVIPDGSNMMTLKTGKVVLQLKRLQ